MTTRVEDFERAWGSHVRGGAEPRSPELRELVAVAEGLRSFQTAAQAPSADPAWDRLSETIGGRVGASGDVVVWLRPPKPRRRMVLRTAAAAVAVFAALATVSLRATPGSFLYPLRTGLEKTALLFAPSNGSLHVHVAEARLSDLVHSLRDGPQSAAPGLAGALMVQRSEAEAHGASVVALDADVRAEVPPALAGAPAAIAQQVRAILGGLLPPIVQPVVAPATDGSGSGDLGSTDPGSQGGSGATEGSSGSDGGDAGSSGSSSGDGSSVSGSGSGGGDTASGSGSGDGGSGSSGDQSGGGSGSQSGDSGSGSGGDQGGSGSGNTDGGAGTSGAGSGGGGSD